MTAERRLGNFHVDLVRPRAHDGRRRDGGQHQHVVADTFGDFPQLQFRFLRAVLGADDPDADRGVTKRDLLDLWVFGQHRKARDPIDFTIDFRHHLLDVLHIRSQFGEHVRTAFSGDRGDFFDPVDRANRLLHLLADRFFTVLRRRPRIRHRHHDDLEFKFRKHLPAHLNQRERTDRHQRHHQDIHTGRVGDRPRDQSLHS
ncbi:hypothetical protein Enr13x_41470 [Stieleria neptunia]|uniref:Uncharacterized protein n=1 Tax=Stieleria neptunia TaxID=2527979 RepID=A0A518HU00_9BACT|nr:hypothetical protein Enr13x_41470 [Stieleria neptunia]